MIGKLSGKIVEVMYKVNTQNKDCIAHKTSKKLFYLNLKKVLSGYIQSAILWYENSNVV